MADKDFFIYTDRNKLLTPSTIEYRVEKLLKPKELKPHINGKLLYSNTWYVNVLIYLNFSACYEELKSEGAQSIFKNFDKIFSMIEFIDQTDYRDLHYVYENILVKSKLYIT